MTIKYSFVIVTYQMKYILRNTLEALNRIRTNSSNNFEVIVVDDGSKDRTFEFTKSIPRNYLVNYVYLSRSSESSRNRCRNMGLKLARGEIIVFMDGDIIVQENLIEELDRCYKYPGDMIVGGFRYFLPRRAPYRSIKSQCFFSKHSFDIINRDFMDERNFFYSQLSYNSQAMLHPWLFFYTCILIIPKHVLEQCGGFDENIRNWGFDEAEMNYRFYKSGFTFVMNSRIQTYHQYHPSRNLNDLFKEMAINIEYAFKKHPELHEILPHNLIDHYYNLTLMDLITPDYKVLEKIELQCTKADQYPSLQEDIIRSKDKNGTLIIVNDYCETTDLDIWIQLLGKTNALIHYFPMSKKIDWKTLKYM